MSNKNIKKKRLDNRNTVVKYAIDVCEASIINGNRPLVLCPDINTAHYVKIEFTNNPAVSVGVEVLTVQEWLINNWRLFQHTELLVSPSLRKAFLIKLLQINNKKLDIVPYRGYGEVLNLLVRQGLDTICCKVQKLLQNPPDSGTSLTKYELAVFELLAAYKESISANELVEISQISKQVCDNLTKSGLLNGLDVICVCFESLPLYVKDLFEFLAYKVNSFHFIEENNKAVQKPALKPKIFCPSGTESVHSTLVYSIHKFFEKRDGVVVVASRDPFGYFQSCYTGILNYEIEVNIIADVEICKTNFGRALSALLKMVYTYSDKLNRASLLMFAKDFVLSSYSGVPNEAAFKLCSKWENEKTLTVEQIMLDMESECIVHVGTGFNSYNKIGLINACLKQNSISSVVKLMIDQQYGTVENNMISRTISEHLEKYFEMLQNVGFTTGDLICLFDSLTCHINHTYYPKKKNTKEVLNKVVKFMATEKASKLMPNSVDLLIIPDLDAVSYSVKNPDNSAYTLLDIVGLKPEVDLLTSHRRMIVRLFENAKSILMGRPCYSSDSEELYDSVMLQQVLASFGYKCFNDAKEELVSFGFTEQNVTKNLLLGLDFNKTSNEKPANTYCLPYASLVLDALCSKPVSASSLELYLRCPYRWFVERILKVYSPISGITPLESGSFAHETLKNFYESFKEEGFERVSRKNIDFAHTLLDNTIDITLEVQRTADYLNNPYIPETSSELAQHQQLVSDLHKLLDRDVSFAPSFIPKYFEHRFGYDEDVYYAGKKIVGVIDRIDIDKNGNAIIVDYKGSAGNNYCISKINEDVLGLGISLPFNIQILIYAQIARRLLNLKPVAALYRSYGTNAGTAYKPGAVGVVDIQFSNCHEELDYCKLDLCTVPYQKKRSITDSEFENCKFDINLDNLSLFELLDKVEANIEQVLNNWEETNVYAVNSDSCKYCDIINCEKRQNG